MAHHGKFPVLAAGASLAVAAGKGYLRAWRAIHQRLSCWEVNRYVAQSLRLDCGNVRLFGRLRGSTILPVSGEEFP